MKYKYKGFHVSINDSTKIIYGNFLLKYYINLGLNTVLCEKNDFRGGIVFNHLTVP